MNVIVPYSAKDYNLAFSAVSIMISKTNVPPEKIIMYGSRYAPEPSDMLMGLIGRYMQPAEDHSQYPLGPNFMMANLFKQVLAEKWTEPFFMCEADGFPTTPDWYERVKQGHEDTGKLCSGARVDWVDPKHINGNMVITPSVVNMNLSLTRVCYEAWDCFHAEFFEMVGADNPEIHNPRRKLAYYPSSWWETQKKGGKTPAWVHGCQNFQMWEHINREWEDIANETN